MATVPHTTATMAANRSRQLVLTKFMKEHSEEHTWIDEQILMEH